MRWIWIDKFTAFEPRQRAVAIKNVTRAEDHLHDQFPHHPMMPTSLIIEGMAQTAGILIGQARGFSERVVLAKVKQARIERPPLPGDQITYETRLEHLDDAGAMTAGTVSINGEPVGVVDLVFSHLDRESGAAIGIPEHNFVFSAEFAQTFSGTGVDFETESD